MRKQTYLRRLRKSLRGVPAREKESLIEYYSELIDDAFERGKTSREVFRELEDPQIVAENYKRENAFKNERYSARDDLDERLERLERLEQEERISRLERMERERARGRNGDSYADYGEPPQKERNEKRSHGLLYWLIAAPIRLILAIVGFALGFAVLIAGLAVVLSVIAVDVALLFGGIYAIVISFHMFTVNLSIALTQVGAGILLIGMHALFSFLVPLVSRGYASLVGWLFRGFRRSDRVREPRRRSVVGRVASVACGLALLIVGGVMGTVGFGRLGYDYRQLAVYDDYVQTVAEYDLENAGEIKVNCAELTLTVMPAQTDKIIVTYYTAEDNPKTVTEEEGTLVLTGGAHGTEGAKQYFKNAWNRGIAFSSIAHLCNRATIEVPESFAGNFDLEVDNGPVILAGITAEQVKVNTKNSFVKIESCTFDVLNAETSNGMITAEKLSAREVNFKTANGYVSMEDSSCSTLTAVVANGKIDMDHSTAQSAELSTHNGAIELEKFAVGDVNLKTHNGAIQGSIKGKLEDYRIMASTHNGSCNLTNKETGTYLLTAHTQNGKISLGFEE